MNLNRRNLLLGLGSFAVAGGALTAEKAAAQPANTKKTQRPDPTKASYQYHPAGTISKHERVTIQTPHGKIVCGGGNDRDYTGPKNYARPQHGPTYNRACQYTK